jgi:hypothetical protein
MVAKNKGSVKSGSKVLSTCGYAYRRPPWRLLMTPEVSPEKSGRLHNHDANAPDAVPAIPARGVGKAQQPRPSAA